MNAYSVELYDPYGTRLDVLTDFSALEYARAENSVGRLTLQFSTTATDYNFIKKDGRIGVYRKVDTAAPYLDLSTMWLIRDWAQIYKNGLWTFSVTAFDGNHLLQRRIVDYSDSSGSAAGYADDICKTIVSQNAGSAATDTTRSWASYLSIAGNLSQGASVSKSYSNRNMLSVLQELAQASTQAGSYLAFDVTYNLGAAKFQFETFAGQRGLDHRWPAGTNPVIFDPRMGNLSDVSLEFSSADEVTRVKAVTGGSSAMADDLTRQGESPFGLIEATVNYCQSTGGLSYEANARLRQGRPVNRFSGTVAETPGCMRGVHWDYGDYVTANVLRQKYDCRVSAIRVTLRPGRQATAVILRSET